MSVRRPRIDGGVSEHGNVLLFALLVMTTVIVGSVGISSLILSSLQQTKVMDSGVRAFYAAESGIEDALYAGRKSEDLPATVSVPVALPNQSSWTRTVAGSEDVLYFEIPEDMLIEVTLYDPDDITAATGIASVGVEWSDACDGCSLLRTSMVGWDPGAPVSWDPNAQTFTHGGGSAAISLGSPAKLYTLRLRAMNADLTGVSVRAYDSGGGQIPIPGRVKVTSIGEATNVRQVLNVTMPRRVPLTGIFDFVIFSECSLVKGGDASCP